MTKTKETTVRIGMVNFINMAPIYEPWKDAAHDPAWRIVEGVPTELNRLLARGAVDLAFISSFACGEHPERYRILADLSISASGPVGSVFLFSGCPPEELDDKKVVVSNQSQTSAALLRIILADHFRVRPRWHTGDALAPGADAVLAIGDQALQLAGAGLYPFCFDLGELWLSMTGLPFVYAVCAVREEFANRQPETLAAVHAGLRRCRDQGLGRLDAISHRVAGRIPMDPHDCLRYLQAMEYDLDLSKQAALAAFYGRLVERGEIPADALPLRML